MIIGNPAFSIALYLTGVHFRGKLQHVGDVNEQKFLSVDQSEQENRFQFNLFILFLFCKLSTNNCSHDHTNSL